MDYAIVGGGSFSASTARGNLFYLLHGPAAASHLALKAPHVCAGIIGLCVAHAILQKDGKASVALIEKGSLCAGATGAGEPVSLFSMWLLSVQKLIGLLYELIEMFIGVHSSIEGPREVLADHELSAKLVAHTLSKGED